jgi:hypothetical protein
MNEWIHAARGRWSEGWKDFAFSRAILGIIVFCALGGIDYARGGRHPLFLYVGLVGLIALGVFVVGYITRRAVLALAQSVTRRS